jgi:hypothetical protein
MAVIGGPHPHPLPKLDGSRLADKRALTISALGGGVLLLPTFSGSHKSSSGHKKSPRRTFRRSSLQWDSAAVRPSPFEPR